MKPGHVLRLRNGWRAAYAPGPRITLIGRTFAVTFGPAGVVESSVPVADLPFRAMVTGSLLMNTACHAPRECVA